MQRVKSAHVTKRALGDGAVVWRVQTVTLDPSGASRRDRQKVLIV
jgi:hypothetical protein